MTVIVTVDSPHHEVLQRKTEDIKENEFADVKEIAGKLYQALEPYFPAAGLAAPQIGVSKSVFIYSYDRDPKNLEVAVNPTFIPIGDSKIIGWECCLSVLLSDGVWQAVQIPRYEKIEATYFDAEGKKIKKVLEGFAAKVYQHECHHLQGIVNIYFKEAEIKKFDSKEELQNFMKEVKKVDSERYQKPKNR